MDKDGNAYCNAWSGDDVSVLTRKLHKQHLTSFELLNCHTVDRFSDDCMRKTLTPSEYGQFVQVSLLSENTARYSNNDYCTQTIMNSNFF